VALGLTLSCQQPVTEPEISVEERATIIDRTLAVWNDGDLNIVEELYAPDLVWHVVDIAEDVVGLEAFKDLVTTFRTAFPDFDLTFDETLVADDMMVIRWTMTGTNTGTFQGLPPTDRPVRLSGMALSRMVDGKTAEVWQHYNALSIFEQMGYTLTPPLEVIVE